MSSPPEDIPSHRMSDFELKTGKDRFSPKDLIELHRPGAGKANTAGDLVLASVSKYSFEEEQSIFVASLESPFEPIDFWLDDRTVGYTAGLYSISIRHSTNESLALTSDAPPGGVLLGKFPTASPNSFRYAAKGGYLVFSDNRPSLFTVKLYKDAEKGWLFGDKFHNVLNGTGHHAPVEPFGGTDDYDVSESYIVYTAKDPKLPEAWHTKQNVYLVDFTGSKKPRELTSGAQGATHNPVFDEEGYKVAWAELDEDGYEADRAKVVIYDLKKNIRYTLTQPWDRSVEELAFSRNSTLLYLTAGDHARSKLFVIPIPETPDKSTTDPSLPPRYVTPRSLTQDGAVTSLQVLPHGRLIYSRSSLQGPNDVFIIRGLHELETDMVNSQGDFKWEVQPEQITRFAEKALAGKTLRPPEDFYFEGAEGKRVHGFVVKPYGWKEGDKKKWPGVLLIHGGPQGAWDDRWSTRWNPNVFAHQEYFVVAINPTGSTTFGQDFTDAIAKDWGGKPFVDLQKGWKYALDRYPEIDPDRAVAAGASWGGYAINWIQGHPEYGFNFKALVCHDGVFDATYNGYSTDELFFFNHDWGGRPWDREAKEVLEKYNPINFVHKWSTPQLVIHGSKDYRLPETDGIGAFHALKQKGLPARLVIFPDENHWVLNHGNSLKWHHEVFRWFDLYLKKTPGTQKQN
ncbi:alpha/beta-hydrolase [Russula aff. rugulosa BPL654]|nr:alpha/beta-hydrolase [Russula aff. rugulosa BPL654]